MSIVRPHVPSPLGLAGTWARAVAQFRLRRAGLVAEGGPQPLATAMTRAWPEQQEWVSDAFRVQLRVAQSAFHQIGGIMPTSPTADDRERLQLLDAVIARLHAAERAVFVSHCRHDPDSRRAHHEEFLRRLSGGGLAPSPPAPARPDVIGRIAGGRPVTLRLRIRALSPAGLVALGQLLHFEREVASEEEPIQTEPTADKDPWVAVG